MFTSISIERNLIHDKSPQNKFKLIFFFSFFFFFLLLFIIINSMTTTDIENDAIQWAIEDTENAPYFYDQVCNLASFFSFMQSCLH